MNGRVLLGLVVFVLLAAFPFYNNMGRAIAVPEPKLDTPEIKALPVKECIESKAHMRAEHMQMLDTWRDMLVRDGIKTYVNSKGQKFDISLQNTCLKCHSNRKDFCDRCHEYAAVNPYCWDCHFSPKKESDI